MISLIICVMAAATSKLNHAQSTNPQNPSQDINPTKLHYTKTTKQRAISGLNDGDVTLAIDNDNELPSSVKQFHHQYKLNPDEPLMPFTQCSKDDGHAFKLHPSGNSDTTTHLLRHKCYAAAKKEEEGGAKLASDQVAKCRDMLKDGAYKAIVRDMRPLSFTDHEDLYEYTTAAIKVGVDLDKLPIDDDINEMIPGRTTNTKRVLQLREIEKAKKLSHLSDIDKEILPAIHDAFDFCDDKQHRKNYLGLTVQAARYKTHGLDCYALELAEWEILTNDEEQRENMDDDEYASYSDTEYDDDSEGASTDEAARDNEFEMNKDAEDNELSDVNEDDEDPNSNVVDNDDVVDNHNGIADEQKDGSTDTTITTGTSVTVEVIQENINKLLTRNNLQNVAESENFHITADRAANNVKCGNDEYYKHDAAISDLYDKVSWIADEQNERDGAQVDDNSNNSEDRNGRRASRDSVAFTFGDEEQRGSARLRAKRELDGYLDGVFTAKVKNASWQNPFDFWMASSIQSLYPTLSKVAIWILTIPAALAQCERLFSFASNVLSSQRLSMKPDTLSALCELNESKFKTV